MTEPFKVGVTGSLGAGKSTLCRLLAAQGLAIIDADAVSRQVTAPGAPVLEQLVEAFGADIIDEQGGLDRARLAARALTDLAGRDRLQALLHPPIRQALAEAVRALGDGGHRVVVIEASMILEGGHQAFYDMLVVVTAPTELKLERAAGRGMATDEARRRLDLQWPDGRKTARADWVVENSGDRVALSSAAAELAAEIERRAPTGGRES